MPILFAFLAFVGWGVGDVFGGLVARKIKSLSASFWLYIFCFFIPLVLVPFFWHELANINIQMWFLIILLNLILPFPMIAFYEGIRVGNASLVETIGAAFAALTVVFSVLFLHDRLLPSQILPMVLIFVGLALSSLKTESLSLKSIFSDKGIPYGLVAMLLWGIYFTFIRIPVRQVGWFWPSFFNFLGILTTIAAIKYKKTRLEKLPDRKTFIFSFLNSFLLTLGGYSFNFAVMKGQTAIVAPIAGSYPILSVFLFRLIFKDKISKQQVLGILISLVGIIALSFSGA